MNDNIPDSVWQGSFNVCGVEIKCHVLSDGRRIIEADSLDKLFTSAIPLKSDDSGLQALTQWSHGRGV